VTSLLVLDQLSQEKELETLEGRSSLLEGFFLAPRFALPLTIPSVVSPPLVRDPESMQHHFTG
jgi:hypothetical protein